MTDAQLLDKIAWMADCMAQSEGASEHFTCTETDSIAEVLVAAGHTSAAAVFVAGHALGYESGDDGGDAHWNIVRASYGLDPVDLDDESVDGDIPRHTLRHKPQDHALARKAAAEYLGVTDG